jgi:hypothetical protein
MFILNNTHGRDHKRLYPQSGEQEQAIFDITERQINLAVNSDWKKMQQHDLVCVVDISYKISNIYKINTVEPVGIDSEEDGEIFVVRGDQVGKVLKVRQYSTTLRQHDVHHERLKNYRFRMGFTVADLESQLDTLEVKTREKAKTTIGELENILRA